MMRGHLHDIVKNKVMKALDLLDELISLLCFSCASLLDHHAPDKRSRKDHT